MSRLRKTLRGAAALSVGQGVSQALSFVRNIVVARLLGPEHFGIAATFAVTMAVVELAGDLAADRLLVQAKDGDDPRLQAAAQFLTAVRGIVGGLILFALAWPIARIFDVPQAVDSFRALGLVPAIRGFLHFDVRRIQREMRFVPAAAVEVVSQAVVLAAAWPLCAWIGDYRAVLALVLLQVTSYVVASHVLAERPYRFAVDRERIGRIVGFGWPLLVNGLLLWGILQGDRFIVGAWYAPRDLGVYHAAFVLCFAPAVMAAAVNRTLALPLLSEAQEEPARFARLYRTSVEATVLVSAALGLFFVVAGPLVIVLVYGPEYSGAAALVGVLGCMQAVRVARGAPSVAAMALADTRNPMVANVARTAWLPVMLLVAGRGAPLVWIAGTALAAEATALVVAAVRLARLRGIPARTTLGPAALAASLVLAAWGVVRVLGLDPGTAAGVAVGGALAAAGLAGLACRAPSLRSVLRRGRGPSIRPVPQGAEP